MEASVLEKGTERLTRGRERISRGFPAARDRRLDSSSRSPTLSIYAGGQQVRPLIQEFSDNTIWPYGLALVIFFSLVICSILSILTDFLSRYEFAITSKLYFSIKERMNRQEGGEEEGDYELTWKWTREKLGIKMVKYRRFVMEHLSRIIAYKIVYPAPRLHNRPRVSSVFYNGVRYLLWVACMGTQSDEDTHTLVVSIEKYDLYVLIFPEYPIRHPFPCPRRVFRSSVVHVATLKHSLKLLLFYAW